MQSLYNQQQVEIENILVCVNKTSAEGYRRLVGNIFAFTLARYLTEQFSLTPDIRFYYYYCEQQ